MTINVDAAGRTRDASELDSGKGGSMSIATKPGRYLLVCNIPVRYKAGIRAEFTVKQRAGVRRRQVSTRSCPCRSRCWRHCVRRSVRLDAMAREPSLARLRNNCGAG